MASTFRAIVAAAVLAPAAAGLPDGAPAPVSPFASLEGAAGVSFSNDRYAVAVHWVPARYAFTLPGLAPLRNEAPRAARHWTERTELRIGCRADNGRPGYGVAAAEAVVDLRRHPDMPGVYSVFHPMFWILGFSGNDVARTSLRVSLTGLSSPLDAVLENPRLYDLGGRLPLRIVGLPAPHLLSLLAGGRALDLDAEGPGTEVSMRFTPDPGLVPAAKAMRAHCPRA